MKIGWLQQNINSLFGGAEMSADALVSNAPDWAEVIYCPPNKRPPDVDMFVLQNANPYDRRWIEELSLKPVVKQVRDPWYAGDVVMRRWLLENADMLIFSSPTQVEHFGYEINRPYKIIPVPINLEPFREAAKEEREGTVFVGRMDIFKGIPAVIDRAIRTGEKTILVGDDGYMKNMGYGQLPDNIRIAGKIDYDLMPALLGSAKNYVCMPEWPEAFGRSAAEAWAAGCNLIIKNRVGAQYWIENEPERLGYDGPIKEFWNIIKEVSCIDQ